jgi:hypothetical protein
MHGSTHVILTMNCGRNRVDTSFTFEIGGALSTDLFAGPELLGPDELPIA